MFLYTKKLLPKNTIEFEISVPWDNILKEKEKAFEELRKNLSLSGFRKGKVPKNIAKDNISKENIYQEMLKNLLNIIFKDIVSKENLKVIGNPKIDLKKVKENEDWLINIKLAIKPKVELANYKEEIKKIKQSEKKSDIWLPGKNSKNINNQEEKLSDQKLLSKILNKLLTITACEISDIIIEEELNRRLTQLLDEIQKLGLTVETYLQSKNLTIEELKEQLKKEIEEMYKLEFIIQEIADKENIIVEDSDLEKLFSTITNPKEKEKIKANSYFYSALIRKQKTLDFILNL